MKSRINRSNTGQQRLVALPAPSRLGNTRWRHSVSTTREGIFSIAADPNNGCDIPHLHSSVVFPSEIEKAVGDFYIQLKTGRSGGSIPHSHNLCWSVFSSVSTNSLGVSSRVIAKPRGVFSSRWNYRSTGWTLSCLGDDTLMGCCTPRLKKLGSLTLRIEKTGRLGCAISCSQKMYVIPRDRKSAGGGRSPSRLLYKVLAAVVSVLCIQ